MSVKAEGAVWNLIWELHSNGWIYRFWHLPSEVGGILRITRISVYFSCPLLWSDPQKQWVCYSVLPSSQLESLNFGWNSGNLCCLPLHASRHGSPHASTAALETQQTGGEALGSEQFACTSLGLIFITVQCLMKTCCTMEPRSETSFPGFCFPAPTRANLLLFGGSRCSQMLGCFWPPRRKQEESKINDERAASVNL